MLDLGDSHDNVIINVYYSHNQLTSVVVTLPFLFTFESGFSSSLDLIGPSIVPHTTCQLVLVVYFFYF